MPPNLFGHVKYLRLIGAVEDWRPCANAPEDAVFIIWLDKGLRGVTRDSLLHGVSAILETLRISKRQLPAAPYLELLTSSASEAGLLAAVERGGSHARDGHQGDSPCLPIGQLPDQ